MRYEFVEKYFYNKNEINIEEQEVKVTPVAGKKFEVANYFYTSTFRNAAGKIAGFASKTNRVSQYSENLYLNCHQATLFLNDPSKSSLVYQVNIQTSSKTPFYNKGKYTSNIVNGDGKYKNVVGIVEIVVDDSDIRSFTVKYNKPSVICLQTV